MPIVPPKPSLTEENKALLWRIDDILQRSGVDDRDLLYRRLEKLALAAQRAGWIPERPYTFSFTLTLPPGHYPANVPIEIFTRQASVALYANNVFPIDFAPAQFVPLLALGPGGPIEGQALSELRAIAARLAFSFSMNNVEESRIDLLSTNPAFLIPGTIGTGTPPAIMPDEEAAESAARRLFPFRAGDLLMANSNRRIFSRPSVYSLGLVVTAPEGLDIHSETHLFINIAGDEVMQ